jgi:hypothetical protein
MDRWIARAWAAGAPPGEVIMVIGVIAVIIVVMVLIDMGSDKPL